MKMSLKSILLAVPCLFALGCEAETGGEQPPTLAPLAVDEAEVGITIVGAGTVTYQNPTIPACSADGKSSPQPCPVVRYKGGTGTFVAQAAPGWRFAGWSLTFGSSSPNTITNPSSPSQTIVPGSSAALTATFVLNVKPIHATFIQNAQSTTYRLDIDNPDLDIVKVQWSGPNCGDWNPQNESFGSESTTKFEMTWHHPHPNCDATTDHSDVTIKARVTIKDKVFVCEYKGAHDGDGTPCKPE